MKSLKESITLNESQINAKPTECTISDWGTDIVPCVSEGGEFGLLYAKTVPGTQFSKYSKKIEAEVSRLGWDKSFQHHYYGNPLDYFEEDEMEEYTFVIARVGDIGPEWYTLGDGGVYPIK